MKFCSNAIHPPPTFDQILAGHLLIRRVVNVCLTRSVHLSHVRIHYGFLSARALAIIMILINLHLFTLRPVMQLNVIALHRHCEK